MVYRIYGGRTLCTARCITCGHKWQFIAEGGNWEEKMRCLMCGDQKYWQALLLRLIGATKKIEWNGHGEIIKREILPGVIPEWLKK